MSKCQKLQNTKTEIEREKRIHFSKFIIQQ